MNVRIVSLVATIVVLSSACDKSNSWETVFSPPSIGSDASKPTTLDLTGSSFHVGTYGTCSLTLHDLVAVESGSRSSRVQAMMVFQTHHADKDTYDSKGCPAGYPYGVDLVSLVWVQTFADGSGLSAAVQKSDASPGDRGKHADALAATGRLPNDLARVCNTARDANNEVVKMPSERSNSAKVCASKDGGFKVVVPNASGRILRGTGGLQRAEGGTWGADLTMSQHLTTGTATLQLP